MKNIFPYKMVLILLTALIFISTDAGAQVQWRSGKPKPSVRLKHLTTTPAVLALIGDFDGFKPRGEGSFTNKGKYPLLPYIYYYSFGFEKKITDRIDAWRSLSVATGVGDETKAELLELDQDQEEVMDSRLGTGIYANAFAFKNKTNSPRDWSFTLYLYLDEINQDNHRITISGTYGPYEDGDAGAPPPMSASDAIGVMLRLVEEIK